MNQKLIKTAEALGIDTKGKTEKELMDLITETWAQEKTTIEQNSIQEFIENGKTRLPEIKKQFEKPFEIWVEKVAQGQKPECLPVVGYNSKTSSVILCKQVKTKEGKIDYKICPVNESLIITSAKKLDEIKAKQKAERAEKTAKTKANKAKTNK